MPMTPLVVACSPVEMSDAKAELLYQADLRRAKARQTLPSGPQEEKRKIPGRRNRKEQGLWRALVRGKAAQKMCMCEVKL